MFPISAPESISISSMGRKLEFILSIPLIVKLLFDNSREYSCKHLHLFSLEELLYLEEDFFLSLPLSLEVEVYSLRTPSLI